MRSAVPLGVALLLTTAGPARAQSPVLPPPEPLGDPAGAPELPRDAALKPEPRFAYWINASEGWEKNTRLVEGAEPESSFVDRVGGGLSYTFRGERGDLSLVADGSYINYHDVTDLDRLTFGGGVNGRYSLSPRSTFSFREHYSISSYDPAEILASSGLPVTTVRARINRAGVDFRFGLGAKTTLGLAGRQESIQFEDDPEGSQRFRDANVVSFGPTLSRRVGRDDVLSVAYSYQRNIEPEVLPDIELANVGWSGRLSRRLEGAAAAGVTRVKATPDFPRSWHFYGSARLLLNFRNGTIGAAAARTVNQAFGLGVERVVDSYSATVTRTLGRRLTASAQGGHARSRSIGDETLLRVRTWSGGGAVRYQATRRIDVGLNYTYATSNPEGPAPGVRFERAVLGVNYGSSRQ